jgi:CheY-like chemotaxis protein
MSDAIPASPPRPARADGAPVGSDTSAPVLSLAGTCAPAPGTAPARVMLVGGDRRFRDVAATLLSLRGYGVTSAGAQDDVVALAARERIDVVIIDADASLTATARQAARLDALRPRVGVVAVSGDRRGQLRALPVVSKWGEFDDLYAAIDQAARLGGSDALH